jgi:hypothetical protein
MERLGWWLCAGLALLGLPGVAARASAETSVDIDAADADSCALPDGALRESHISYPLEVDGWHAASEHRFEDQAHGVCIRFTHGEDIDRWIDLYFYPAGALSPTQFAAAAREEADLIRQAHLQAGHAAFDMGPLQPFVFAPADADSRLLPGQALDLVYAADGATYSSAMTLLLDRMHFIKARFSIREDRLARRDTREQLQAFTACLQRRVRIVAIDSRHAAASRASAALPSAPVPKPGMREIRLDYGAAGGIAASAASVGAPQASAS